MKQKIRLTDRDRMIFQLLFEHRVLEFGQIWKRCCPKSSRCNVVTRLNQLYNGKYVEKKYMLSGKRHLVLYMLLDKGLKEFAPTYEHAISSPHFKSDSILHDLDLFEVRERIQDLEMIEGYYTENMLEKCQRLGNRDRLRSFVELHSDVAIQVKMQEDSFFCAVEYEGSEKAQERYEDKLLQYYTRGDIAATFWICKTDRIMDALIEVDKGFQTQFQSKMYFASLDSVLNHSGNITFQGISGDKVVLK